MFPFVFLDLARANVDSMLWISFYIRIFTNTKRPVNLDTRVCIPNNLASRMAYAVWRAGRQLASA